ncbi:hypothetical protein RJ640_028651 [Escallonia rubra]|uniref:Protein FLX-like 4 n=1 Tax=Escallonia rubra TaxID=112253 RepID=A0AA88QMB4_9ASTE|nr:hypothetical protein RJ640_028651 [Escallonia rubra]
MAARGHIPAGYGAPGMMRHGPFPAGQRPRETFPPELENKLAVQAAEIERLDGENRRLAATQVALRQDLAAAQQDIQRHRAHLRSIQTETDIQIRMLLDKIAKMEVDIRAGESIKKELQQAHIEAQSLLTARQELTAEIQRATLELDKAHADVKKLPEMHAQLDSLRLEHHRLRTTFEYEKGLNIEKVGQMQVMEKDLVSMAREMEKLRAEVLNAEKRARAPNPYGGPMYPPPPMHATGGYGDSYGRPHGQMGVGATGEAMIPYGSGNAAAAPGGVGSAAAPSAGGNSSWGGGYDASYARR